jgi:basic membrane protein A
VFDVGAFAWGRGTETKASGPAVGLVFDVGGRGDKSFNDAAWAGLERVRDELHMPVEYIEPGDGADREGALRMLAAEGAALVIGVGFIFTDDVTQVALDYPDTAFACVDYALRTNADGTVVPPPPNVAALKFREEEGSYLVGALAGLTTKSRAVGFVGGMDIPLIRKFEAGYRAGVAATCPDCRITAQYAGVTGAAFKDPGKGKALALGQYGSGVDIIYHASGSTGLGVFEAARETDHLAIGVDADQSDEAPGHVLTSMVKRVDVAVLTVAREVKEGRFVGGIRSFGLAEDGVAWVHDAKNAALLPAGAEARLGELSAAIGRGEIAVPSTVAPAASQAAAPTVTPAASQAAAATTAPAASQAAAHTVTPATAPTVTPTASQAAAPRGAQ